MIKYLTIIDPTTGWFEIVQYNDKQIIKPVEQVWLFRYPMPAIIMYGNGKE